MGVLQFGWLGREYLFLVAMACWAQFFGLDATSVGVKVIMVIWGVLAAFVGLKGIQYVAKVATYLPLIPLAVLLMLLAKTAGGIGSFDPQSFIAMSDDGRPEAPRRR